MGTVLLLGELDDKGRPHSALAHFGSEAYEHYMVAPYVRELLMVRNTDYVCWSPHFEHLYAAILALGPDPARFEELGSTLFSTIDKIEKLRARYQGLTHQPTIEFAGIEISKLLIDLAETLHQTQALQHFPTWQSMPQTSAGIVSRSYQSTSYALRKTGDLFDWMSRSKFGIHGVWFCIDGGEVETTMVGNRLTFFDPDAFAKLAADRGIRTKVVKCEVFSHGHFRFAAAWVMLDRMSDAERSSMHSLLARWNISPAEAVCGLDHSDLGRQPFAGPHASFAMVETGAPFNFFSADLMDRFHHHTSL
jgi:hypothetical protein